MGSQKKRENSGGYVVDNIQLYLLVRVFSNIVTVDHYE